MRLFRKLQHGSRRGLWPAVSRAVVVAVLVSGGVWTPGRICADLGEAQFRDFYQEFYRNPHAQQIPAALDYFTSPPLPDQDRGEAEIELAARARFFAVLADAYPVVWRQGERNFPKIYWPRKNRWLEVFKRNQDEQLKANVRRWASQEEDHDRRIWLEQLVVQSRAPLEILDHPIRDQSQLEEHWACFFAVGNTRVVRSSVALLGNTSVGFTWPPQPEGNIVRDSRRSNGAVRLAKPKLLPRERRLRDRARWDLINRAARHPLVRQALLTETKFLQSEPGFPVMRYLAYQALESRDAATVKRLADLGLYQGLTKPGKCYFQGVLDFLEGRERSGQNKIRSLEREHRVWAEQLRALGAYLRHRTLEKTWQRTALPAGGKKIPQRASLVVSEAKSLAVLEIWDLETIPREERPNRYYREKIIGSAQPDRRFSLLINAWPREGWAFSNSHAYRWNNRQTGWVAIENQVVSAEMAKLTELIATRQLLSETNPSAILKIIGTGGVDYAELHYPAARQSELFQPSLAAMFPHQSHQLRDLRLIVELESGRPLHLQADLDVFSSGKKIAVGRVERFFYAYDTFDLDWMERLR